MARRNLQTLALICAAGAVFSAAANLAAEDKPKPDEATLKVLVKTGQRLDHACDKAVDWLIKQQNADGSYGRNPRDGKPYPSVGLTGMALRAILSIPHTYRPQDGPFVTKPGDWLVKIQKESGVIVAADEKNANYETAVAVMALAKLKAYDAKTYGPAIDKAAGYLKGCQYAPADGDAKSGGVGYRTGDTNVDLPNSAFFLDALSAAGYKSDSPEFKNALAFLARCQASSETNKEAWAQDATDGGGRYNEKGVTQDRKTGQSTGAMSYALFSSYLRLQLPATDPRVGAVLKYISAHYNVDEHPGLGADGLFYYYLLMSQALDARAKAGGGWMVKSTDGVDHAWTVELGQKLVSLQQPDGSFVNSKSGKFWESDPVLCTSYAMIAMGICNRQIAAELDSYGLPLPEDD